MDSATPFARVSKSRYTAHADPLWACSGTRPDSDADPLGQTDAAMLDVEQMASSFSARTECPACASPHRRTIFSTAYTANDLWSMLTTHYPKIVQYRAMFDAVDYTARECVQCKLIYQEQVPSDAMLATLYGEWMPSAWHPDNDAAFAFDIHHPMMTRPAQELYAFAHVLNKNVTALRTLDFGMGWGRWAICAARLGVESYGYDLSSEGCQYAALRGVRLATPPEFDALRADVVVCDQTLEHVVDPRGAMNLLAAAVVRGGIVKITVPTAKNLEARFKLRNFQADAGTSQSLNPLHPLEHLQCFRRESLERLARAAGLAPMSAPLGAELAYWRTIRRSELRYPKHLLRAAARPAYNRFSAHNLHAWYRKL